MPLARIEQACDELERRRMVIAAGDAFRFRHALIREAAYDSLSKASRAQLHERHAERLARAEPAPADRAALIGFQLESAYACAAELGRADARELAVRARDALAAAADDAHRNGNLPDEIGLLERAIRLPGEPRVGSRRAAPDPDCGAVRGRLVRARARDLPSRPSNAPAHSTHRSCSRAR